jgi:hypothetical protein
MRYAVCRIHQHDAVSGRERRTDGADLDAGRRVAVVAQLWNKETLADAETGGDRGEPVFAAGGRIDKRFAFGRNFVSFNPGPVHIFRDRVFGPAGADTGAAPDALCRIDEIDPPVAVPVVFGGGNAGRRSLGEDEGDDHASRKGGARLIQGDGKSEWVDGWSFCHDVPWCLLVIRTVSGVRGIRSMRRL